MPQKGYRFGKMRSRASIWYPGLLCWHHKKFAKKLAKVGNKNLKKAFLRGLCVFCMFHKTRNIYTLLVLFYHKMPSNMSVLTQPLPPLSPLTSPQPINQHENTTNNAHTIPLQAIPEISNVTTTWLAKLSPPNQQVHVTSMQEPASAAMSTTSTLIHHWWESLNLIPL